ncbi:hypothetical protein H6G33_25475 [Calothrix sp. FACHB-1219]|uniref:hypothetical protein n=1 Tax=unclassified Calothrix TaxID=2619626 RepID=UPI0016851B06|nr:MULTISPECIES: hypothetical protein [unclassified Calothrix]MBD2208191.1 hypothetical protein [Calothrix sp. FACHB-168]MBD2220359.1 hypothetical protein [Calothrix sp. FACHB-1219]
MKNQIENGIDSRVLKQTWPFMRATFSQAPENFKQLVENLPELFAESETDIDLQEKRKIYLTIAKFLRDKFQKPLPVSLGATHILCNEPDPRLLLDGVLDGETQQLVESAKEVILTIKVLYEPLQNRSYNRQIEILWLKNDNPKVFKVEEELSWDYLPTDISEKDLHYGAKALTFKLYQLEA